MSYTRRFQCVDHLQAHVVDSEGARIHGFHLTKDLARHYGAADSVLLALTGDLPTAEQSRAFEVATMFASPITVADAPTNAALQAKLCDAPTARVISIGALALAEQAREEIESSQGLLHWLDNPGVEFPSQYTHRTPEEAEKVEDLSAVLAVIPFRVASLSHRPSLLAALLGTFHACGLKERIQLEAALVLARLPCVVAETRYVTPLKFRNYPLHLPEFRYEE